MDQERWRAVIGFEGTYEVSDLGRVRSLDRMVPRRIGKGLTPDRLIEAIHHGVMLNPGLASNGYLAVSLKRVSHCIHELVLSAFVGRAPDGTECCHGDGVRQNNRLDNLRWGTLVSNRADMIAHGTRLRGTDLANAKLNNVKAKRIRELRGVHSQSELARMFNVSPAAIQAVHDGRSWKHV